MFNARMATEVVIGMVIAIIASAAVWTLLPLILHQEHMTAVSCSAAKTKEVQSNKKSRRMEFRCGYAAVQGVPEPMRRYEVSSDGILYVDVGNGEFHRMTELPVRRGRAIDDGAFVCTVVWSVYPDIPFTIEIPSNPPGILSCREAVRA